MRDRPRSAQTRPPTHAWARSAPGARHPHHGWATGLVILLAAVPFLLGKYVELGTPDPYDSSMFVYSAQHILQGARIGLEEIPSAHIGTLLVNLLGVKIRSFGETGPKVIQGLMQLAALILMVVAMRRLFEALAASVGLILASCYLSAPVIAKFGNVKEQYMIAVAVGGISCFLLYLLARPEGRRRWIWAVTAGALLSWAPLFKPTGVAAPLAVIFFVLTQPVLRHQTLRQAGRALLLLGIGAGLALAPLYIWIIGWGVKMPSPYGWLGTALALFLRIGADRIGSTPGANTYIESARRLVGFSRQAATVCRYYLILILPIGLALGSILGRIGRRVVRVPGGRSADEGLFDRSVLLLGVWWGLDMVLVWVSPRPYEQYYLPLTASGCMLGGYGIALAVKAARSAFPRGRTRAALAAASVALMFVLAFPIFAGITSSPNTGKSYGGRMRGFLQRVGEVRQESARATQRPWALAADYIRAHSQEGDGIYVWGWVPGIYLRARRFSPAPAACTSEMQVYPPEILSGAVSGLLATFSQRPPKFIVDTHNRHFPYDPPRPVLELWPTLVNASFLLDHIPGEAAERRALEARSVGAEAGDVLLGQFIRADRPAALASYEAAFARGLDNPKWPDEAKRFAAMKPFRDFVMANYRVVHACGEVIIFERTTPPAAAPIGSPDPILR